MGDSRAILRASIGEKLIKDVGSFLYQLREGEHLGPWIADARRIGRRYRGGNSLNVRAFGL